MTRHKTKKNLFTRLSTATRDRNITIKNIYFAGIKNDCYRFAVEVKVNRAKFSGQFSFSTGGINPTMQSNLLLASLSLDGITLTDKEHQDLTDRLFKKFTDKAGVDFTPRPSFINIEGAAMLDPGRL